MDYIQDRKLKIRLLEHTGKLIAQHDTMICTTMPAAIRYVRLDGYDMLDINFAVAELTRYITDAIYPWNTYGMWLHEKRPDFPLEAKPGFFVPGRLAWINWMIACYEEDIANYKENK